METITLATVLTLLAPFATEAGKTLAVETVKLALEKRKDIKDKLTEIFKPEFISLNLNDNQSSDDVNALIEAKPDVKVTIQNKIESNSELLNELAQVLSKQEKRTIYTKYYIENVETGHFS